MTRSFRSLGAGLGLLSLAGASVADTAFDAPGNSNPIVPGYFADPTLKRFGDTFHLYATTDGNGGGRGPATVWVSRDFTHWVLVPMNWPTTPHYWAPDVVEKPGGRYYLYYNQPCNTYGGVSDSPRGPWMPLTPGDGLVIKDRLIKDVITLDSQVFEDRDGTLYAYWGTWGIFPKSGCGVGLLNPDMKSFARLGMIPNTQAKDFFEAPFMIERNGVYYFTYSSGSCHDASYRVQYAVGSKPDGDFKMGPNNPILASTPDGLVHGPGHHSILQLGGEYLIVYHRHDIPVTPNGMHRQTCVDRLEFESDGVIRKIEPTHRGVGPRGLKNQRGENLAFQAKVTASSHYSDTLRKHEYKPEYAVDDNNATLWRPADNRMGHWLVVDLGRPQRVRRTQTQFEYATWFYQYLIEASLDGQSWQPFADRRHNSRWGSPMVDDGDVEARYLRLTITGTEFPGLFGAVWNFKAYADAPADPLLAMATTAFDQFIAPKQKQTAPQTSPLGADLRAGGAAKNLQPDTPALLIHLDVADLQLGAPITAWTNLGKLVGVFASGEAKPVVGMAGGRKAVRFSGKQALRASFPAPRSLAGNSSFSVAAWVNNPEVGESECLISWAGRGGPDATTAQFGYGTQREWGAVGHWGFADMGFRGAPPKAGHWHHLAVVFDGVVERLYVNGQFNNSEAKMLLMHEGRPVFVGASEPGMESFDGYLASLRVYDGALAETEVAKLAADAPSADVLVHVDAARLDYGPLMSWANEGALDGAFVPLAGAPVVTNVGGRMAVWFERGQGLELPADSAPKAGPFTLLASVWKAGAEASDSAIQLDGSTGAASLNVPLPVGSWHQAGLVSDGQKARLYLDGQPLNQAVPAVPMQAINAVLIGSRSATPTAFKGALSQVQLFRRVLSNEELSRLHTLWKTEVQRPEPDPAAFDQAPAALWPEAVAMTAQRGKSAFGSVEYCFTETTGRPGGSRSGWTPNPFFLDDELQPDTRYAYTVQMRDPLGNVTTASAPAETDTESARFLVVADRFQTGRDFLAHGVAQSLWDGFLGKENLSAPEVIAARDGALRLQSKGTVWDGGKPLGAFLYKRVAGDFVVQVKVVDYAGLDTRRVPGNNDGGLMARVAKQEDAGPGEDLVQLNFFPIWNQGNMVTSLDGGRSQKGNGLAWDAHRHLQIIRQGARFFFRTSADGVRWTEMPGSPVERQDMAGLPLQVGLYHASYGGDSSHIAFSNFELTTQK